MVACRPGTPFKAGRVSFSAGKEGLTPSLEQSITSSQGPEVYVVFWSILMFMWSFGGSLGL